MTLSVPKLSIDNNGFNNVLESSDMPKEPRDSATKNVTSDAVVTSVPLDELFDYDDDISVQSVLDDEPDPPISTSDSAQRQPDDMNFVHPTEPSKRRLDG